MEIMDIFLKAGRVKSRSEHEPRLRQGYAGQAVKAPSRKQVRTSYEKVFRDELQREDRKLMALPYPEETCDPRRRQELADGGMIREDQAAMANLPRQAIHHEYPRLKYYSSPYIGSLGE